MKVSVVMKVRKGRGLKRGRVAQKMKNEVTGVGRRDGSRRYMVIEESEQKQSWIRKLSK